MVNVWEQRKLDDVMSCITDYVAAGSFADIKNNVSYMSEPDFAQLVRTVDAQGDMSICLGNNNPDDMDLTLATIFGKNIKGERYDLRDE